MNPENVSATMVSPAFDDGDGDRTTDGALGRDRRGLSPIRQICYISNCHQYFAWRPRWTATPSTPSWSCIARAAYRMPPRRCTARRVTALAGIFVIIAAARLGGAPAASAQKKHSASQEAWLRGVSDGSTRVVDMTYAINGKLPAWPGDDRTFEAKTVATPEKDGYFARSFWTLEHYGTHLDAPAHFPPGKEYPRSDSGRSFFRSGGGD